MSQKFHLKDAGSSVVVGVGDDVHHYEAGDDIDGVWYIVNCRNPSLQGEAEDNDIKGRGDHSRENCLPVNLEEAGDFS